jgi:hypothetical protein
MNELINSKKTFGTVQLRHNIMQAKQMSQHSKAISHKTVNDSEKKR